MAIIADETQLNVTAAISRAEALHNITLEPTRVTDDSNVILDLHNQSLLYLTRYQLFNQMLARCPTIVNTEIIDLESSGFNRQRELIICTAVCFVLR